MALVDASSQTPDPPRFEGEAGTIAAVLMRGTVIGDLWLVANHDALAEFPEILRAGLPVIFFDEVEHLRDKSPADLQTLGIVKTVFPTARVLQ